MTNIFKLFIAVFALTFISCGDDDSTSTQELQLNLSGLEDLGSTAAYEGWIMVDGAPQTTGIFTVNSEGVPSQTTFDISSDALDKATAFILTIEPSPDNDPAPSAVHILAGDFSTDNAPLTVSHSAALGTDLTSASGSYILATPTDDIADNEASGVWFLDNSSGTPEAGLSLPALPSGWAYEGWAVIDGTPVTTGTFTSVSGSDAAAPYSGANPGPAYPGEDFVQNAPAGVTFPTDLRGATIVVSVEPVPDNSALPFTLKPLISMTPAGADVHSVLSMANNASSSNPTGTATRK